MIDPASIIIGFLAGVIVAGLFYLFKIRSFAKTIKEDLKKDLKCARQLNRIAEYVGTGVHGASPERVICRALLDFIFYDKPFIDNNEEK